MKRVFVLLSCVALGCGGRVPQYTSPQHKKFLKRFESQVASKNLASVKQLCKEAEKMHAERSLTDEQYEPLKEACDKVEAGDWDKAAAVLKPIVEGQAK